ncbi:MAG: adenosylhomocysteinase [Desulfosudis oleivorans]|nr:adenosylhomocysteinase [Desulfosudis oleivorans]
MQLAACLHVTTETADLMQTLKAGGAERRAVRLQPARAPRTTWRPRWSSTTGIPVFAIKGEDHKTYYAHINAALDTQPQYHHGRRRRPRVHPALRAPGPARATCVGGTEETTTGVIRLRSMAADGVLQYPIIAVNDARTKHFFDNRYGTGQSTIDGIHPGDQPPDRRARTFVVCGYGWCGRGVAMRAQAAWAPTSS